MAHTVVPSVEVDDFGKASWAILVRAADIDLTARTVDLETALPVGDLVGTSDAQTLTNKTLDEASNSLTLSHTEWWPAGIHDGTPYLVAWSANADASAPVDTGFFGTNITGAELEFVDGALNQIWHAFKLPSDWVAPLDISIVWRSVATSGNVVWQVQTAGAVDGGSLDPTMNAAQTVTDAAQGTTNRMNTATISSLTTTGLVAGGLLFVRLLRDPGHASDTLGASAFFLGAELKYRRQH